MNKIINLHCHSHFSLLDGMSSPLSMIEKTQEFGLNSIAITDHGNMNNFGDFYLQAIKKKFKPIFGVEFFTVKSIDRWKKVSEKISNDGTNKKEVRKKLSKRNHLVLLAKNENGLKNINSMLYESYKEGNFFFRPRIDRAIIEKFHKDIICSSACLIGEIQQCLLVGNQEAAEDAMNFYRDLFGKDFYLEIQFNELKEQAKVNLMMFKLAKKNNIKAILTGDSHYTERKHQLTHQTLLLLQTKKTMKDLEKGDAWEFSTKELYIKNYDDYKRDMKRFNPEISLKTFDWLCENTLEIESKIEKIVIDKSVKMKDASSKIDDKDEYLKDLCFEALKKINMKEEKKKKYIERLKFELNVIKEKKMANYFLTVYGIVRNARKSMLVGCGRGSSCGSLVNYLLQINEIDPLKYHLYFERFMSIDRSDIPDIDLDFENNDVVKNTIIEKYGSDAAFISNYNTFQISGLIKDLGRTYGLESPFYFDKLNKRIHLEIEQNLQVDDDDAYKSITFDDAYKSSKTFKNFVDDHKELRRDLELLIGKIRNIGKHAAGMIACDDLVRSQPTLIVDGKLQTSLSEGKEKILSEFGFVKMDILGLNTLKILHWTLDLIGKKYDYIHPDKIDLKDEKIYKHIFRKANLLGIFQFETNNIRQLVARTKPDCFQDLVAMNALFRPGPLKGGLAFEYGGRKRGEVEIEYENKIVEKILGKTYGIIIYQEQVMELGHFLGGLSLPETNTLRKLLVKVKKNDEENKKKLEDLKDKFYDGCKKSEMQKSEIDNLWEKMVAFAGYGFNLAHAVAYAMIAYQCSFLKYYHMKEFYCSLLNMETVDNYGKIINEIRSNDIEVKTLDINKSAINFSIKDGIIYCGFSNVMGIGEKAATTILASRKKKDFEGLKDFITREDIDWRLCNKRVVETLIKIGAFDFGSEKRNLLLEVFNQYNEFKNHLNKKLADWNCKKRQKKISEIYNELKSNKKINKKMTSTEKSAIELSHYRFNVDFSPFVLNGRKGKIDVLISKGKAGGMSEENDWMIVQFMNIKRFNDKNGNEMCFLDLIDINNVMKSALIFSSNYEMEKVKENGVYLIQGKVQDKVLIDEYRELDSVLNKSEEN